MVGREGKVVQSSNIYGPDVQAVEIVRGPFLLRQAQCLQLEGLLVFGFIRSTDNDGIA